ncbi:hypothetical protein C0966_17035 (plasmid) [Bacillus methanolicus]|uniref:hypothetical protein n=1 Tax=Bacillus methanolicus TaxID=1471 RepID=UPI0023802F41|nr:hypothetical protein [Bacillus methanolicus]MDE3840972.1 hypothetical protein [Bacillus methanolicus]
MDQKNYHSRLLNISNQFDPVIEKLKSSYIDEKYSSWYVWLATAPLRDIEKVLQLQQGIISFFTGKFFVAFLPLLSAIFGPLLFIPTDLSAWVTPFASGFIGYLITMAIYFPQLTRFDSDHFHTGAYQVFRRQEYDLFKAAFLDPQGEFYFKGIYDYVTNSKEGYRLVERLIHDFLQNERTNYESKIHYFEEKIKDINKNAEEITSEYNAFTEELISERDELLTEFEYVIQLLKDLNTLLFRMHNKGLTKKDLNVLTGFTLYELRGDKLVQIEDVGTSGITAEEISLSDPRYSHYGVVKVIKENLDQPYFNHPYPGHVVVSYRMRIDQKAIWVYNFHFDDSNTRAWKLLVENDIIESKEIYRLVHALCLLSQDFDPKEEKGAVNQ